MLKNIKENFSKDSENSKVSTRSKCSILSLKSYKSVIKPSFKLVENGDRILLLKDLFVLFLTSNLCDSVLDEIRFLLEVISKRISISNASHDNSIKLATLRTLFISYHNCFYFAYELFVEVFIRNTFIHFLNITAFNHILECGYLVDFRPDADLRSSIETLKERKCFFHPCPPNRTLSSFVMFQPDTDCKSNFPNVHSFTLFRKQRDQFYNLFKCYNENHWFVALAQDKKVQHCFESNIRAMFALSKDVGNSYHLARLFVDQLQRTCTDEVVAESKKANKILTSRNETDSISITEDRFKKLHNRFVNKNPNGPTVAENLFDDQFNLNEKFFRDFIYYADSYSFNEQLKLILKSKLLELTTSDVLFNENAIQSELRENFTIHITNLNLLAKILGFVCYYSLEATRYESQRNHSDFYPQQRSLRHQSNHYMPILDIETYLANSMKNHLLIVAIPWVIHFLSFVDQISLSFEYFDNVMTILMLIYKCYLPVLSTIYVEKFHFASCNRIFIQLYLEKLFTNKKFAFQNRFKEFVKNNTNQVQFSAELREKLRNEPPLETVQLDFNTDLLDSDVIGYFFPNFSKMVVEVFKQIPSDFRKITPTCVSVNPDSFASTSTRLQNKVEDMFVNIHSSSMKKCIQFVNDQLSASCIKMIKTKLFPKSKRHFEEFLRENSDLRSITDVNDIGKRSKLVIGLANRIRGECKESIENCCATKVETIFSLLLTDEWDSSVINFAIKMCLRNIELRCTNWIDSNITDDLIKCDLVAYIRNGGEKNNCRPKPTAITSEQSNLFPETVYRLREILSQLSQGNLANIAITASVVELLASIDRTQSLDHLHTSNGKFFHSASVTLAMAIVVHSPQSMNDHLIDCFIDFWTKNCFTPKRMICPKHLHWLSRTDSPIASWLKFEFLLKRMLKAKVISFVDVEEESLAVLKCDWNANLLNKLASVLQALVDTVRLDATATRATISPEIVEWLSWICAENNFT